MNKVFSCAGDCIMNSCYQDTDNTHLDYDDVPAVVERCKPKSKQELVGEYLGDVHAHFPAKEQSVKSMVLTIDIFVKRRICMYVCMYV